MKIKMILRYGIGILLAIGIHSLGFSADVNERYPYRLPDWIWDTNVDDVLSANDILELRSDIAKLKAAEAANLDKEAELLSEKIAGVVGKKFSQHDLAKHAQLVFSKQSGLSMNVLFDPQFTAAERATVEKGVSRFLAVALDRNVIKKALARSSVTPKPMPLQFLLENGKQKLDDLNRPMLTDDYKFYLSNIAKPKNVDEFYEHLKYAMSSQFGKLPILIISTYSGNVWWGGSYYSYFSDPLQVLRKEAPPAGYFYIRLNTDKLKPPEPGWNDENFWASKIAHEVLHNLGYWHPAYQTVEERSENNKGNEFAFIYAYEVEILARLKKSK